MVSIRPLAGMCHRGRLGRQSVHIRRIGPPRQRRGHQPWHIRLPLCRRRVWRESRGRGWTRLRRPCDRLAEDDHDLRHERWDRAASRVRRQVRDIFTKGEDILPEERDYQILNTRTLCHIELAIAAAPRLPLPGSDSGAEIATDARSYPVARKTVFRAVIGPYLYSLVLRVVKGLYC